MSMKILKITHDPLTITYELMHETTRQQLTIKRLPDTTWEAYLSGTGEKASTATPEEAVKEMGAWFYKLSQVIMEEEGNFGKIDISNIS
jgi:hypothetical protein